MLNGNYLGPSGVVHNILYYIDKNDILGQILKIPAMTRIYKLGTLCTNVAANAEMIKRIINFNRHYNIKPRVIFWGFYNRRLIELFSPKNIF